VAGCCECGDEPSGSCATELVVVVVVSSSSGSINNSDKGNNDLQRSVARDLFPFRVKNA
jgi:hypothetical protein